MLFAVKAVPPVCSAMVSRIFRPSRRCSIRSGVASAAPAQSIVSIGMPSDAARFAACPRLQCLAGAVVFAVAEQNQDRTSSISGIEAIQPLGQGVADVGARVDAALRLKLINNFQYDIMIQCQRTNGLG